MSQDLACLDATGHAELVQRGEAQPKELVDAAIARIERVNPQLNAVIMPLYDKAMATATNGLPDGLFRGVPFLLKDIFATAEGDPYHMGLRLLRDVRFVAPFDSYLVAKTKAAGLVCVGRTNVPELGVLPSTESDAYGPARNPWDPERSTGGSSGGAAAAVAAGLVPVAHANDGGGSIRIPASECGLVGLTPSRGRSSLGPLMGEALGGFAVEGCVSRTVRDTATFLDVISGAMPGDPYTAPPPPRPYRVMAGAMPGRVRIGVMTRTPGGIGAVHPDCVAGAQRAATALAALGHVVEESHPAALDELEAGQHATVVWATYLHHLIDELAPLYVGRRITPDDVDPLNWALADMGRAVGVGQYLNALMWLQSHTRRVAQWWADGFDLLLTPTLPEPPPLLGHFRPTADDPVACGMRASAFACFTMPFNVTGQPAISLPLHWTASGLPVGVQLAAAYGREDLLIRVASQLEQAQPWRDRRPRVHA
ncbi:MAG: amidase [Candidatus Binatia bacterium]